MPRCQTFLFTTVHEGQKESQELPLVLVRVP